MISHCANPRCTLPFHYLRGGRLYRFDITSPSRPCADVPNAVCTLTPPRPTVFFWLCDECSSKYSLRFNFHDGIGLLRRPAIQRGRVASRAARAARAHGA